MIVLIPVYQRPEFLKVCLEYIQAAELSESFEYWFLCDFGFDPKNIRVIDQFPYKKRIIKRSKHRYKPVTKQSFNLLEGYKEAVATGADNVFLIEDDIFVANDFFKWHLEAQKFSGLTIATANNNTKFEVTDSLDKCYIGADADYQSLGVCWDSAALSKYVLPHANELYYKDPVQYCVNNLPQDIIGKHFVEQDGLIRRCIQGKLRAVFPHVARAFHAGFIGYNRKGKKPEGVGVDEKAKRIKEITSSHELYKKYVARPEYYEDSKPVNLVGNKWEAICI